MRNRIWIVAAAIAAVIMGPHGTAARDGLAPVPNQVVGNEITPESSRAVELGLAFLAARQQPDGGLGMEYNQGVGHVAVTSLAGLAFMSAGNLPGRGRYGQQVQRCLDFILAATQESGVIVTGNSSGPMYGHGFATLFLGEIYGMAGGDNVKEKLQKAVRLIQNVQNPEGGWRYNPQPADADISVTICQIMALRSARDAGLKVDRQVIDRAVAYVRRCQNPDGGFSYQATAGTSGFARSAAGVASLYYAGVFEGNDLKRGLDYLKQFSTRGGGYDSGTESMYFYGHYYAAQAMFLAGEEYWASYFPAIRDQLVARQDRNTGSWRGEAGLEYATAMACIILQMPHRYLPVFHGKGPGG